MYEIQTPEQWQKVSGVIRWPDPEDVTEAMWDMYRDYRRDWIEWHDKNKKERDNKTDPMHINFDFAAAFTLKFGEYDLDGIDLNDWQIKKAARRIKVVSWMSRQVDPYWLKVLDPNA